MASHPPSKCCLVGFKHEGNAEGEVNQIGTHQAYTAYPKDKSTKHGLILFPDFMGYELINAKLIADQFAANGYFTIIPDIWEGDNVPLNWDPSSDFNLGQWMGRHGPEKIEPIAEAAIKAMKEQNGVEKLASVGYCLGAKYVCRFMAKGKVDAGYIAHPSATSEDEIKGVAGPLSIAAAETDDLFPASKRHQTEEILREMNITYQLTLFGNSEHGFALKADLKQQEAKFVTETAFLQAVHWFDHFVKGE